MASSVFLRPMGKRVYVPYIGRRSSYIGDYATVDKEFISSELRDVTQYNTSQAM